MLNIRDLRSGHVMLGVPVDNWMEAYYWLEYYRTTYGPGTPYPNGKGFYSGEYVICHLCDCGCEKYHTIH
jgi:hypothetical protein